MEKDREPFFLRPYSCCQDASKAARQTEPPEVNIIEVLGQRVVLKRELPGRTVAFLVSDIRPQVNGLILKRAFDEGSFVNKGDLLYQIDPAPYQASYDQAMAAVSMAEANLPAVRSREARFKELVACGGVGQQDYDNALAALRQAEAQLASSKAALEMARINLSYTPIKAPISGRIGRSSVTEAPWLRRISLRRWLRYSNWIRSMSMCRNPLQTFKVPEKHERRKAKFR
jgi:membrane fusion protein (multidrug efflux system)